MFGKKKVTLPRLGIYIHIPFCRSKCDYCDFYSLAGKGDRMADYQKALLAHIRETAPLAEGYQVDTIYVGGGTPSFYGEKFLRELLSAQELTELDAKGLILYEEAEGSDEKVPRAINIMDYPLIAENIKTEECYLVFIRNTPRKENCIKLWEHIKAYKGEE